MVFSPSAGRVEIEIAKPTKFIISSTFKKKYRDQSFPHRDSNSHSMSWNLSLEHRMHIAHTIALVHHGPDIESTSPIEQMLQFL